MARSVLARIQDILNAVSHLTHQQFYGLEDVIKRMEEAEEAGSDPALRHRMIEKCVARGVLGRAGGKYLLRRAPSPDDLQHIAEDEGVLPEPETLDLAQHITHLPEMFDRLRALQRDVTALQQEKQIERHWLVLTEELMPPALLTTLRTKVSSINGHSGAPADAHRLMVHLCSQIIQQALKDKS